jgi:hypothetical protein
VVSLPQTEAITFTWNLDRHRHLVDEQLRRVLPNVVIEDVAPEAVSAE